MIYEKILGNILILFTLKGHCVNSRVRQPKTVKLGRVNQTKATERNITFMPTFPGFFTWIRFGSQSFSGYLSSGEWTVCLIWAHNSNLQTVESSSASSIQCAQEVQRHCFAGTDNCSWIQENRQARWNQNLNNWMTQNLLNIFFSKLVSTLKVPCCWLLCKSRNCRWDLQNQSRAWILLFTEDGEDSAQQLTKRRLG